MDKGWGEYSDTLFVQSNAENSDYGKKKQNNYCVFVL